MTSTASDETVLVRRDGRVGRVVLNRPRVLNALSHDMVGRIDRALDAWAEDDEVSAVVLTGAGERGLCAGGDIRSIHEDATYSDGSASMAFWRDEYLLNARIARFPKPYVAVMDGIVMGGGVGLAAHGGVRIVTESSRVAMPETGIGFVPDVGGTYLLARAPGELGTHLALTAGAVGAADAMLCGLADHFVPADRLEAFTASLTELDVADSVSAHARPAPSGALAADREWIDDCYSADTVEEILDRLRAVGQPAAKEAAARIEEKSPTALKVTLRALRRARDLGALEQVLDQEFRVSCAALSSHDLREGIRAQVIDKDRSPRWSPPTLEAVTEADVARYFVPLGERELGLGTGPERGRP